jgi:hypothetical protein
MGGHRWSQQVSPREISAPARGSQGLSARQAAALPTHHPRTPPTRAGRTLKTLKKATLLPVVVTTAPAATVAAPAVTISPFGKLLAKTGLVVGGGAAAAAATPAAPVDPAPRQEQPAAATPAASTSGARAPAPQLPPPRPVAGNNDIGRALQCQSAFNGLGGRTGVEALLGDVCREGSASFDALGCCQKVRLCVRLIVCMCNAVSAVKPSARALRPPVTLAAAPSLVHTHRRPPACSTAAPCAAARATTSCTTSCARRRVCGWCACSALLPPPLAHARTHARTHPHARTHARTHTRTHARTHARPSLSQRAVWPRPRSLPAGQDSGPDLRQPARPADRMRHAVLSCD